MPASALADSKRGGDAYEHGKRRGSSRATREVPPNVITVLDDIFLWSSGRLDLVGCSESIVH